MLGYFQDESATSEVIDTHGWLHTGDIGYYDSDNYLYVTGRMKDIFKVKGRQVSQNFNEIYNCIQ